MSDSISVGDYVRFSPFRDEKRELDEVGVVVKIDSLGVLEIEPKSFHVDSFKSAVSSYRRYEEDVIKMTDDETMMYMLEK